MVTLKNEMQSKLATRILIDQCYNLICVLFLDRCVSVKAMQLRISMLSNVAQTVVVNVYTAAGSVPLPKFDRL